MNQIKQFKLTNDDEIICEVIQWEDDEVPMLVKGAMKIISVEDYSRGVRFYAFRPWMGFTDDPEVLHIINSAHIIGTVTPNDEVVEHYDDTLEKIKKAISTKNMPLDEIASNMESMDEDEFEDFLDSYIEEKNKEMSDSDQPENVIKFKPKGTMH